MLKGIGAQFLIMWCENQ